MAQTETTKPSDEIIRQQWAFALRLFGRNRLGHRIAFAIADRLEKAGVTDADIDRVMESGNG